MSGFVMTEQAHRDNERYLRAMHAMQTAVKMMMELGDDESSPKHLRVGVNSSLVSSAALARLLVEKGVFTTEEFFKYLADEGEREVQKYQDELFDNGLKVRLA